MKYRGRLAVAVTAAAALLVGGGAALAGDGGPQARAARCEQLLERLAAKRGMSADELKAMRKERALERVAEAVAAGRITDAKAAAIRSRLEAGRAGCGKLLRGAKLRRAGGLVLRPAAEYLGMSVDDLKAELRAGNSLAQIAARKGRSVGGLEDSLVDSFEARLDRVARLTDEQRAKLLERFEARLERILNRIPKVQAA
jgi:hypothetical protein